jgi:hypothetical protein
VALGVGPRIIDGRKVERGAIPRPQNHQRRTERRLTPRTPFRRQRCRAESHRPRDNQRRKREGCAALVVNSPHQGRKREAGAFAGRGGWELMRATGNAALRFARPCALGVATARHPRPEKEREPSGHLESRAHISAAQKRQPVVLLAAPHSESGPGIINGCRAAVFLAAPAAWSCVLRFSPCRSRTVVRCRSFGKAGPTSKSSGQSQAGFARLRFPRRAAPRLPLICGVRRPALSIQTGCRD